MTSGRDRLEGSLGDGSAEVRRRAVEELAGLPEDEALPLALRALGDGDWRVRKEAIALFTLRRPFGDPGPALLAAIEQEENVGLRNAAAEVLAGLRGAPVDLVVSRLPSLDGTTRKIALEIIGRSSDPRRARLLVEHLSSPDLNLGATAAELLGDLGGDEVVAELARCLGRGEQMLVLAALQSLNRLEARVPFDRLEPLVGNTLYGTEILFALSRSGDPAAAHVILGRIPSSPPAARAMVRLHGASEAAAAAVEAALGMSGPEVSSALTRLAAAEEPADRDAAASCLLWTRRTEHVPLLVELAREEPLHLRVVEGLAAWGKPVLAALDGMLPRAQGRLLASIIDVMGRLLDGEEGRRRMALFTAYLNSNDLSVATAALGVLGRIGDETAVPRLIELAQSADKRVRRAAVHALVLLAERHAGAVRAGLRRVDLSGARGVELMRVVQAVGEPGDASIVAAALNSLSPELRRAALGALAAVAGTDAIGAISLSMTDENAAVRRAAVAALARLGPAASETIVSALRTAEGPLRAALVRALGGAGHPGAREILNRTTRESARTAIASLEALARLGIDPGDMKGELLAHPDPEVVKKALALLDRFVAEAELIALLSSPAWDVRLAVVERLAARSGLGAGAAAALRSSLAREENDMVRDAIERALARRGSGA